MTAQTTVWVFQGEGQNVILGCFATRAAAEAWIVPKQLSGVLTAYPLNCPIYSRSTQPYTALASPPQAK